MATRAIRKLTRPLPSVHKVMATPPSRDLGKQEGRDRWAHLLHLVVLILIRLLAVFRLQLCPLFEGLLLRAAQEGRVGQVRGPSLPERAVGVASGRGVACPVCTGWMGFV